MAVASDLPALEQLPQVAKRKNSVLYRLQRQAPDRDADLQPGPDHRPAPTRSAPYAKYAVIADRGPALLRELAASTCAASARAFVQDVVAGPPGAGRLDDHPAVRQERAAGAVQAHGLREAARGRAGLPPHAQVVQGADPHRVPQHGLLRQRRLRDRGRGAHVLRRRPQPPGCGDARQARCAPSSSRPAEARAARRRSSPRPSALRPGRAPGRGHAPAQPRAQEDARAGPHHASPSTTTRSSEPLSAELDAAARRRPGRAPSTSCRGCARARRPLGPQRAFEGGLRVQHDARPRPPEGRAARGPQTTCPARGGPTASVVVIDNKTGEVRAMVGGRDYDKRAVQPRHPGPAPAGLVDQALHPGRGAAPGHRARLGLAVAQARTSRVRKRRQREVRRQQLRGRLRRPVDARQRADALRQLGLRRARHQGRHQEGRPAGRADGHPHAGLHEPRDDARRPARRASRRWTWPTPTRRSPPAASASPARWAPATDGPVGIHEITRAQRRQGRRQATTSADDQARPVGRSSPRPRPQLLDRTVVKLGTGDARAVRRVRRRQDRHDRELRRRLVRRLHDALDDRGLGRLPRRP